jgi:hypothetical protein
MVGEKDLVTAASDKIFHNFFNILKYAWFFKCNIFVKCWIYIRIILARKATVKLLVKEFFNKNILITK